jgi:outer membrane biosynthesis protein TonB
MNDFVESAKNFVSAAVSRTSWEAQKQLRIHSKQSEIDKLIDQRQQLVNEMVQIAMSLYQKGALTDPNLSRLCASIMELDHDVSQREMQLQEIKKEVYPAEQFAPAPTSNYTPPPTAPYAAQPQSQPPYQQPPQQPRQPQQPQPVPQIARCPQCGNEIRPGALYCRSCGAKLQ